MRRVWLALVAFLVVPQVVWGHGGEDHGDSKPVATKSGMTSQLAKSEAVEVLLKYPRLVSGQESRLLIFVTDVQTNAPRTDVTLQLDFALDKTSQAGGLLPTVSAASGGVVTAKPTSLPGMYEVTYLPPEAGKVRVAAHLKGASYQETVIFSGVTIASMVAGTSRTALPGWAVWGSVTLLVMLLGTGWLWFIRKRQLRELAASSG